MPRKSKKATAAEGQGRVDANEAVPSKTLSSIISDKIRGDLYAGQIASGQRLGTEKAIAEEFGVSRMAARDALRSLEAYGIVDIKVGLGGGIFVAKAEPKRFSNSLAVQLALMGLTREELLDAQIAIEVTAIGLAAQNATQPDLDLLYEQFEQFKAAMKDPGPDPFGSFAEKTIWLHEGLINASNNRVLIAQFEALRLLLEPIYRGSGSKDAGRDIDRAVRSAVVSHAALLECLTARDAENAQALIRTRLQLVRKISLENWSKVESASRKESGEKKRKSGRDVVAAARA